MQVSRAEVFHGLVPRYLACQLRRAVDARLEHAFGYLSGHAEYGYIAPYGHIPSDLDECRSKRVELTFEER